MKLTPELLAQAPSALNPVKERQLDLRGKSPEISFCCYMPTAVSGYKIPAIENLGVTKVAYMISLASYIGVEPIIRM
jgi:U2 small nuclear ribonucleoprotein A'